MFGRLESSFDNAFQVLIMIVRQAKAQTCMLVAITPKGLYRGCQGLPWHQLIQSEIPVHHILPACIPHLLSAMLSNSQEPVAMDAELPRKHLMCGTTPLYWYLRKKLMSGGAPKETT